MSNLYLKLGLIVIFIFILSFFIVQHVTEDLFVKSSPKIISENNSFGSMVLFEILKEKGVEYATEKET